MTPPASATRCLRPRPSRRCPVASVPAVQPGAVAQAGEAPRTSGLDPGSAFGIGALVLFLLSCAVPWYGRSEVITTAGSLGAGYAADARVMSHGGEWLVVAVLFVLTTVVLLYGSRAAVVASVLLGAATVVGVVLLVRSFPAIALHAPPHGDLKVGPPIETRLVGAALAVLAAGLLAVGVVLHAVVRARAWRPEPTDA